MYILIFTAPSPARRSLNSRLSNSKACTYLSTTQESSDSYVPVSPVKTSKLRLFIDFLFTRKSKKKATVKEDKPAKRVTSFATNTKKFNGKRSGQTSDATQLLLEPSPKIINENNKNNNARSKGKKSKGIPIKGRKNGQRSNGDKVENKNGKQKQLYGRPQDIPTTSSESLYLLKKPVPGCSYYPTGATQTNKGWKVNKNTGELRYSSSTPHDNSLSEISTDSFNPRIKKNLDLSKAGNNKFEKSRFGWVPITANELSANNLVTKQLRRYSSDDNFKAHASSRPYPDDGVKVLKYLEVKSPDEQHSQKITLKLFYKGFAYRICEQSYHQY